MKNDLISRQAAIDALFELYEYQRDIDPTEAADLVRQGIFLAEKKIENLPSAQPYTAEQIQKMQDIEQAQLDKAYEMGKADALRWIPCSERLPDRFGKMLVTFIPGTLWTYVIIANYSDLMGIAKPCFWIGNVGKSDFANITSRVVAWMPLPEPYREVE